MPAACLLLNCSRLVLCIDDYRLIQFVVLKVRELITKQDTHSPPGAVGDG